MTTTPCLPTGRLFHGGDYNPDQWLDRPDILAEDLRLMKLAGINAVSLGIFTWVNLEPADGQYQFAWLDGIMENLWKNGVGVFLATPSGSKPAWLSQKYPEVCRCDKHGQRQPHHGRQNHCPTSPVYREKVVQINSRLAERYRDFPGLLGWHVSNEYGGHCYCPLCWEAFRNWLAARYGSLKAVNQKWWSQFWSHTFTDWSQINFLDDSMHGMELDYRRFMTDQVVDFFRQEIVPLRRHTPHAPVTVNMMPQFNDYDYWRFAPYVDVISWDSYPAWHEKPHDEMDAACHTAYSHEQFRTMNSGRPFLLIESTPSRTNWQRISRPKRPGMNRLQGLQAIAHGADSVMYFQYRAGRGGCEKFHGAVVEHPGHENTRTFREIAQLGAELRQLSAPLAGTLPAPAKVAVVFDWPNRWAIDLAKGPRNVDKNYDETCQAHYRAFWRRGIGVDVIESICALASYQIVVAPMLYMIRPGVAEALTDFVQRGGTLLTTYLCGIADENDLCFTGGLPGPLRKLLGLCCEETDVLHDHNQQAVAYIEGNPSGLTGTFPARHYCDVLRLETAQPLANYTADFYAGSPAISVNCFGQGKAYHVAARLEDTAIDALLGTLIKQAGIKHPTPPPGATVHQRAGTTFIFNWNHAPTECPLDGVYIDQLTGKPVQGKLELHALDARVLRPVQ